jgi:hypothetical protein
MNNTSPNPLGFIGQIIWFITGVIVAALLVRFGFALLGANTDNALVSFVYDFSEVFVAPFRGILQIGEFQAGISRFEFETLIAVAFYSLIGYAVTRLFSIGRN